MLTGLVVTSSNVVQEGHVKVPVILLILAKVHLYTGKPADGLRQVNVDDQTFFKEKQIPTKVYTSKWGSLQRVLLRLPLKASLAFAFEVFRKKLFQYSDIYLPNHNDYKEVSEVLRNKNCSHKIHFQAILKFGNDIHLPSFATKSIQKKLNCLPTTTFS